MNAELTTEVYTTTANSQCAVYQVHTKRVYEYVYECTSGETTDGTEVPTSTCLLVHAPCPQLYNQLINTQYTHTVVLQELTEMSSRGLKCTEMQRFQ